VKNVKQTDLEALIKIVGDANVLTGNERIQDYLKDETAELMRPRSASDVVVIRPANAEEVSKIMRFANDRSICVFPRGGGTGLVGGAVPSQNGIVLSLNRMTKVEIDKDNLMAVAESGVTLERLVAETESAGLSFPLHPGDESAQIGGLAATNAGGANAIRYGVMRNYVKGLEIVLASGEILNLGGKLQKDNVTYDFVNLILGSEGTLAVITKAILRLYPRLEAAATLIVPYNRRHDALNTVPKIFQEGRMPVAVEYVEKDLMEKTAKTIGEQWPVEKGECFLLIVVAETNRDQLLSESEKIAAVCQKNSCLEILFAEPADEQRRIARIRSNVYAALKPDTCDILDVTVPPSQIGRLLDSVDDIARRHGVHLPMYGHAGDGNLHIHIMKEKGKTVDFVESLRNEIYQAGATLKGVFTGEHGVGRTRIGCVGAFVDRKQVDLMKGIKKAFDPNNILNPEVKFPI
jgi:glycolate oxidase